MPTNTTPLSISDQAVDLVITIRLPIWQSEEVEIRNDLEYELGMLIDNLGGITRDARIEMEVVPMGFVKPT